ncbi:hypothetical protein [Vibrio hepatarius]|uniref:hypothetical protein n=1 Tax=Vibrio hepatarius TaxID=171383 RepID=UPI001C0A0DBE|nr:hypothetical protein [Vibrio hepatarius]MBU2899009.1 hypothetical protein [Vibrio hepatarius]
MNKSKIIFLLTALYSTHSLAIIDLTPSHIEVQGEQCENGYRLIKPAEAKELSIQLYNQNKIDVWGRYFLDNGKTLSITQDNSINVVHDAFEYLTNISDNDPSIPTGQSLCTKKKGNFYAIDTSSETKYQKIIYNELAIDTDLSDGVLHTTTTDQVSDIKYGQNLISRIRVLVKVATDNRTSFMIRAVGENPTPDPQVSVDGYGNLGYVGLAGTINGKTLRMRYNGTGDRALGPTPRLLDSFLFTPGSGYPLMKYWEFKLNLEESISEGYVLATLNVFSDKAQKQLFEKTNISLELNDAEYFPETGVTVVGNSLLSSPIHFRTDEYSQNQWSSYHLLYSASSEAIDERYFSGKHIGALSNSTQENKYADDLQNLILAQHTAIPLELPTAHRRQKRCVEDFIQSLQSLGAWAFARWLGEPSVCGVQNHQLIANVPPLIVDEPQPTGNNSNVVYEVIEAQPHSDNPDAFNTAMNVLACDDNVNTDADEGTCTTEQNEAINLMGDLTHTQLGTIINDVQEHLNLAAQGAGPALSVDTGNQHLNDFINHNPEAAIDLLNSAMLVANASNVKPDKLVSRRNKKGKKRNDNVLTGSCANNDPEVKDDDGYQCVQKIRRRANIRPTETVVSVPPLLQTGGQYFTRSTDSSNFHNMVLAFNNSGVSSRMNRNEVSANTWAIAYDGAPAGNNRRFVVLSDANDGRRDRFGFGLTHIWTNRDGGHQRDFMQHGFHNQEMLARMIMAALTSVDGNPRITTRTGEGGQRRDYAAVTFVYGRYHYLFTNVAIVVGSDGYVITAFPTRNSRLSTLEDEL